MLIVLERAKSSILPNGNFREFFLWRGEFCVFKTGIPGGPESNPRNHRAGAHKSLWRGTLRNSEWNKVHSVNHFFSFSLTQISEDWAVSIHVQAAVASLGLVSPGAVTEGVTPIFSSKKTYDFFVSPLFIFSWKTDDLWRMSPEEVRPRPSLVTPLHKLIDVYSLIPLLYGRSRRSRLWYSLHKAGWF